MGLDGDPDFDAYHKWLGIPPVEQPPHHYRLLGIALFERDLEVIAAAADRQMAHIKSFAAGRHAGASQTLLNELAKTRVTLLNVGQREAYDRRLEQSLARPVAEDSRSLPAGRRGTSVEPAQNAAAGLPQLNIRTSHHESPGYSHQRRRSSLGVQWLFVAAGAAAVAGALCYAAVMRPEVPAEVARAPVAVSASNAMPTAPEPRPQRVIQPSPVVEPAPIRQAEEGAIGPREIVRAVKENAPLLPPPAPKAMHEIDLDLTKRVQRLALPAKDIGKLQVVGLRACESPYKIDPIGGNLNRGDKVTIAVSGARVAIWEISINSRIEDKTLLEVTGLIVTDDERRLPLTLANVGRVCRQLTKQSQQAKTMLESLQVEQARLSTWLDGPGMKPLAEVGPARARLRELTRMIPEQSGVFQALDADLRVAEQVQAFAQHLDEKCVIEISAGE